MGWEDDPPNWVKQLTWGIFVAFVFGLCTIILMFLGKVLL